MSLDYSLENCAGGKTNGELIDSIAARLEVDDDRAAELTYNVCVALMVTGGKLDTVDDIAEVMARLTIIGQEGTVSPALLDVHRGIETNVSYLTRKKWWDTVTGEYGSLTAAMNSVRRGVTRELAAEEVAK